MKTRILFLIPSLENGGAEKVFVNLLNKLNRTKYDITVRTFFDVGVHKRRLPDDIRYVSSFKKAFPGYSKIASFIPKKLLYWIIIKEEYNVVISFLEGTSARVVSGCPYRNSRKIAWIHTAMTSDSVLRKGFLNMKNAITTYNSFDRIVFVSNAAKDAYLHITGNPKEKCIVIYNSIDASSIRTLSNEKIEDIEFNKDVVNICTVGKITKVKGLDRLAHALLILKREGKKIHIYSVGTGEQKEEIETFLRNNDLYDSFTFLGYRENPYKYVKKCDIYVCSSYREGLPTAVIEALIIGTPVVSVNCSGIAELLGDDSKYGIVVENSQEGIVKGLRDMLAPEKMEHYRKQAKIRGEWFSKLNTVDEVEKILDEVSYG